jgi:hypothetical protein
MLMKKVTANETESDVPEVSRQFFSQEFQGSLFAFFSAIWRFFFTSILRITGVERAIPVKSAISAVWQKQKWTAIQDHSFALNDLDLQKLLQKEARSDNI